MMRKQNNIIKHSDSFHDGPDINLWELASFSESVRYFSYSTHPKHGWQFLYNRAVPQKETKHNEPFKVVLKNSCSLGDNSPKNEKTVTLSYSNNI